MLSSIKNEGLTSQNRVYSVKTNNFTEGPQTVQFKKLQNIGRIIIDIPTTEEGNSLEKMEIKDNSYDRLAPLEVKSDSTGIYEQVPGNILSPEHRDACLAHQESRKDVKNFMISRISKMTSYYINTVLITGIILCIYYPAYLTYISFSQVNFLNENADKLGVNFPDVSDSLRSEASIFKTIGPVNAAVGVISIVAILIALCIKAFKCYVYSEVRRKYDNTHRDVMQQSAL